MQGHPEEVYACEFLDESNVLTASADRLFLWNMEIGTCIQEASCTPGPVHQGKLSNVLASDMSTTKTNLGFLHQNSMQISHCDGRRSVACKMAARLYLQC